jgi:hypothetical protein
MVTSFHCPKGPLEMAPERSQLLAGVVIEIAFDNK